ncbi:protein PHLOEM PROTEIN 2-LIKE A10-like [Melia azedarach]|uniref:Protein PHLOEM PROTEIN 2-LIKE A10-like n=1 Tax=Melia azedarach TaxID=155640 RepID=A0ACC1XU90_MELAZ|nr:protein PHLOEM PROTEIN 2-LIKE A10-like [Melia azedarach]
MDLQWLKKGLDFTRKKKKWLLLLSASSFSGYGLYRVYNLPAIARKRKRVLKLLAALISVAEAISDSAETIGVVSRDLKVFLQSDSDQIPNSLKQISKIMNSKEFSESVVKVTEALTVGILRGHRFQAKSDHGANNNSSFEDKVLDKLFTTAGTGFASVVVGSFARNLVMAFYSGGQPCQELHFNSTNSSGVDHLGLEKNSIPRWLNVLRSDEKCRELIGDCIQLFVSNAVAVYLDKTMDINTYDEFFAGLTNPKHEAKVRDVLLAVCNGAIETLVKTSHQVLTSSNSSSGSPYLAVDQGPVTRRRKFAGQEALSMQLKVRNSFHEVKHSGWVGKVSSTLAVPSNRQLVLDLTGRVTFEMVRSFLEILMEKLCDGMKRSADVVHEAVVDSGLELVKYVTARSSAVATICLSLCLHILDAPWILA